MDAEPSCGRVRQAYATTLLSSVKRRRGQRALDSSRSLAQHLTNKLSIFRRIFDEEDLPGRLPLRRRTLRMRNRSERGYEPLQLFDVRQGPVLEGDRPKRQL